jgi:anti-sigma B factor antagonist
MDDAQPVAEFSLTITTNDGGRCHITVTGEVDVQTAPEFEATALARLRDPVTEMVALELAEVSFIDSTGIGTLVQLRVAAAEFGKQLVLAEPSQRVRDLLELTALTSAFSIEAQG